MLRACDRDEEGATTDLLLNRSVPRISAPQRASVKPDLKAGSLERVRNACRGFRILGCVAEKDGSGR
jgi:hypothetical protein